MKNHDKNVANPTSIICFMLTTMAQIPTIYRRSGNFHVKYTSPFNFSRCFIFVARAHQRKLNHVKIFVHAYTCTFPIPGPDTMSRHWREAGASDQRQRGNAADTHAVSLVENCHRLLTSKDFTTSVSVHGSNCPGLQKFASAKINYGENFPIYGISFTYPL